MLGLRRDVSLLLSEGHCDARRYSIGFAINEASIARQRYNKTQRDKIMIGISLANLANMGGTTKLRKDTLEHLNKLTQENFSDDT